MAHLTREKNSFVFQSSLDKRVFQKKCCKKSLQKKCFKIAWIDLLLQFLGCATFLVTLLYGKRFRQFSFANPETVLCCEAKSRINKSLRTTKKTHTHSKL